MAKRPDVFISYSRLDRIHAERISRQLETRGMTVWWDRSLLPGSNWDIEIGKNLKAARLVLVLWSRNSYSSDFVRSEAMEAREAGKLIAAKLEDVRIGPPFNIIQTADLSGGARSAIGLFGGAKRDGMADLLSALSTRLKLRDDNKTAEETNDANDFTPSGYCWKLIEGSLDPNDYRDLVEHFPQTPEAFLAALRIRELQRWAQIDKQNVDEVRNFLSTARFQALTDEGNQLLQNTSEASAAKVSSDSLSEIEFLPNFQEYLNLDLSASADIAERLLSNVEGEAIARELKITSTESHANLIGATSAMRDWFTENVLPSRNSAIDDVESWFLSQLPAGDSRQFRLPVLQAAELDLYYLRRSDEITNRFAIDNSELLRERDETRIDYERFQISEEGRSATTYSPWVSGFLISVFATMPQTLNLSTLRTAVFVSSDIMALALSVGLGLLLIMGAWSFGSLLRQSAYLERMENEGMPSQRPLLLVCGLVPALASLGFVAYAHHQNALQPGFSGEATLGLAGLLGGNLLAFFIAVFGAFFTQDPNPEYSRVATRLRKIERKYKKLAANQFDKPMKELNDRYQSKLATIEQHKKSLEGTSAMIFAEKAIAVLQAKDNQAAALLQRYKSELFKRMKLEKRPPFLSLMKRDGFFYEEQRVSLHEFMAAEVVIRFYPEVLTY